MSCNIAALQMNADAGDIRLFELRLPTSVNPDIESEAEACSKDTDAESADMLRHEIRKSRATLRSVAC